MSFSELLNKSGETQEELAKKFCVYQTTISAWMRGVSQPPRTRLPVIAAVLGLPVDEVATAVEQDRLRRLGVARALIDQGVTHGK